MELIFYGKDQRATYAIMQLSNSLSYDYSFENGLNLEELKENALEINAECIVIDYAWYNEYPEEDFVSAVYDICNSRRVNIIFFMPGYSEDSHIVASLSSIGFNKFFLEDTQNMTTIQNVLKDFISSASDEVEEQAEQTDVFSYYSEDEEYDTEDDYNDMQEDILANREAFNKEIVRGNQGLFEQEVEKALQRDESLLSEANSLIKVAVCGILPRIGTTRVALQLCKTANLLNEGSAAYIEVNGKYLSNLCRYYEVDRLKPVGISFENISMYKAPDVPKIAKKGYSVLIYDFGVLDDTNAMSILDKDIVVVVGSSGPSEIAAFTPAIRATMDSSVVNYIFYDVPNNTEERDSVMELMGKQANKTSFVEHVSDPFNLKKENMDVYKKILSTKADINIQDIKKRKRFSRAFG